MRRARFSFSLTALAGLFLFWHLTPARASVEAVISVADQRMAVLKDGGLVAKFPVSTSKFGVGDQGRSYKTPLGRLKVCDKIGEDLPVGTVIKHRQVTGEVLAANAPGRDPIVTRILWLEGCESQNANARERSIYIHGTVEESKIGKPVSYGCIRMRSQDVVSLYEELPVGASVTIIAEKLPRYAKYVAPPPQPEIIIAKREQAPPPPIAASEKRFGLVTASATIAVARPPEKPVAVTKGTGGANISRGSERSTAVVGMVHTAPIFTTATSATTVSPVSGGRDMTHAMGTSILLSGMDGMSGNSEIPRLER